MGKHEMVVVGSHSTSGFVLIKKLPP